MIFIAFSGKHIFWMKLTLTLKLKDLMPCTPDPAALNSLPAKFLGTGEIIYILFEIKFLTCIAGTERQKLTCECNFSYWHLLRRVKYCVTRLTIDL